MSKIKNVVQYTVAYVMWIVSFLLWLLFILLGREAVMTALQVFYMGTSFNRRMQMPFFDRAYLMTTGIIWLILMVFTEHYFRVGVEKGLLAKRIGKVFWPIITLIFLSDLTIAITKGFGNIPSFQWASMSIELLAIAGMIYLATRARPKRSSSEASIG